MKKLFILLAAFAVLVSCKSGVHYSGINGEKTQKDAEAEFVSSLSKADQDALLTLGKDCMDKLQAGQVDEAVGMIYVLYNGVVYKKSADYTKELVQRFKMFPVLSYSLDYADFSTEGNNDLSYRYVFAQSADGSSNETMKLMFNPVFVDGEWYLTLKDLGQSSKAMPKEKQIHELAPAPKAPRLNKPSKK